MQAVRMRLYLQPEAQAAARRPETAVGRRKICWN